MHFLKKKISPIALGLVMATNIGCGGGSSDDSQIGDNSVFPVVAAGDFETMYVTVQMSEVPQIIRQEFAIEPTLAYVGITFDTNNDSVMGEGDLRLAISPTIDVTGLSSVSSSLTRQLGPQAGAEFLGSVDYDTSLNEVTFTVPKSLSDELNAISTQTQVNVVVALQKEGDDEASGDSLPESGQYTQLQNVSYITDPIGDYIGTHSQVDIFEFRLAFE